jgi:hypothetical protein
LFNKKLYEATETGWLDLGKFVGDNGKNGKDGWMITADPANVIITQGLGSNSSQFSTVKVGFMAKKGIVAATISSIGTPTSTEFNVAKGTGDDAKKVVVSSPKTHGTPAEYYTEGTFLVTVNVTDPDTSSTVSFNVTVPCYANLLGTWKREVENGVETVVAQLTQYLEDEDGNIITSESLREDINDATRDISTLSNTVTTQGNSISNLNTRMSTAEGNISTVTKKVNSGKNLLFGVLTGSGWNRSGSTVKTNDEEKFTLSSGQYLESPDITIESSVDYYTISYDANTQATIGIYDYGIQQTVSGTNGTTDDGRYYFRFAPGSLSGEYQIRFSGVSYIKHPQLETGNAVTAFEADSTETSSRIKQTADSIELKVKNCGIDIDDQEIDLTAGKVNFLMPGGSTNAKISIDPTTGALNAVDLSAENLHAVNAILSGSLLCHRLVRRAGNEPYVVCFSGNTAATLALLGDIVIVGGLYSSNLPVRLPPAKFFPGTHIKIINATYSTSGGSRSEDRSIITLEVVHNNNLEPRAEDNFNVATNNLAVAVPFVAASGSNILYYDYYEDLTFDGYIEVDLVSEPNIYENPTSPTHYVWTVIGARE